MSADTDLQGRLLDNDAVLILGVVIVIYAAFTLVSAVLGLNLNGTVNTLQRITFLSAAYAMLVLALNLHWGYAGLFNIGVAGFMAVGVYTMGMLTGSPTATPPGLGLPLTVGIAGGMAAAAIVGAIAALPALRLRADYLAIVTIALSEIIRLTYLSTTFQQFTVAGVDLGTGGGQGIDLPTNPIRALYYVEAGNPGAGITPFGETVFGFFETLEVPFIAGQGVQPTVVIGWTYAIVLIAFVGLFYWLLVRVGNSPFGRVLKAIREDELVASSLGKNTGSFKIKVFMLGCALMGLAGILWQGSRGFVNPDNFRPLLTFFIFIALIIGGPGSNTGSVIGGAVFASLLFEGPNFVKRVVQEVFEVGDAPNTFIDAVAPLASLDPGPLFAYSIGNISALRLVFLGVIVVYLIQRRPDGLLGHRKEIASSIDLSRRDTDTAEGESR